MLRQKRLELRSRLYYFKKFKDHAKERALRQSSINLFKESISPLDRTLLLKEQYTKSKIFNAPFFKHFQKNQVFTQRLSEIIKEEIVLEDTPVVRAYEDNRKLFFVNDG